jgi:hypothetical protein
MSLMRQLSEMLDATMICYCRVVGCILCLVLVAVHVVFNHRPCLYLLLHATPCLTHGILVQHAGAERGGAVRCD